MLARLVLNSWTSGDVPASASQSAGVTGMSHCVWWKSFKLEKEHRELFHLLIYSFSECSRTSAAPPRARDRSNSGDTAMNKTGKTPTLIGFLF